MGDGQEQDHYVEQLREVFNSFDTTSSGSLSPEELSDLCQSLHLDYATLLEALLQNQDRLDARVDFEQFKNALIFVLSSTIEQPQADQEPLPKPESPEIQPKLVKGSKRYGRRSTPEFIESVANLSEITTTTNPAKDLEDNYDSAVPRKRERWNTHETSTGEEYEAEGQMHLWNPDEPSTPRGSDVSLSGRLEERLHEACDDLALSWDGFASHSDLLALCDHLGLEVRGDVLQTLCGADGVMRVQEFVSKVISHNKPPTPSASTPYRQLKRMHSTQPFDEGGRRIATPSALTCSIGLRLFSTLDDGMGYTPVEYILDAWTDEGIENSTEILQALNFSLDGKLSLSDLTMALENELLVTKNGIHQAALASFKAEIRHLLEHVDRERKEKEKILSDLEKAERLKTQLATEVDEHHSAIEQINKLNLRKLEEDHKEKLSMVRSELMKEMDQIQQQSGLQREELEAELEKIREDESFLRDHLSISVKENHRLEMELLDNTEKLIEAQNQITKLQTNLDKIMKDKFGDLDPGSAEFLLQEERIKQLHISYEAQCRELQDRIDELQSELQEFHSLGQVHPSCHKRLSEELESKSPGMESDPGIGSEEVQPFSMSLEAEMMLEQLKDRHLQEMEELRNQLESKVNECKSVLEKQKASHEEQKAALAQQHQRDLQALKEDMASVQSHAEELQGRVEQAELEQKRAEEQADLGEEEVQTLRQQLLEAHTYSADLDEQLRSLEEQQTEMNDSFNREMEELKRKHAEEITKLEQTQAEMFNVKMEEEKKRLLSEFEKEQEVFKQNHENELRAKLEEAQVRFEKERGEIIQKLTEQWQKERAQLDEQNTESLQLLLEEEMMKLVREQEEKENRLRERWETERTQIQEQHEDALLQRLHQQTLEFEQREKKLKEDWEREKLQLEEDYEGMVQERLSEELEKMEAEKEEEEKRFERLIEEERVRLQESHRETVKELTERHRDEREALSSTLDQLREEITQERSEARRLSEENLMLRQKIATLKEEDLKGTREELIQTLDNLKKEKLASQKAGDYFKKQISELQSQSQLLKDKNGMLSEKNGQHLSDMEALRQQLSVLVEENDRKKKIPVEDKSQLAACVSALEAELNKALDDTAQLKQRNTQLSLEVCDLREKVEGMDCLKLELSDLAEEKKNLLKDTQVLYHQLAKAQEKVKSADENLQALTLQSSRLKSDVRVLQQQKDSLQHEVALLHKKLQNANDKNQVLEMALHSSGLQSRSKKLLRDELTCLMEQEQKIQKQENERLQVEVLSVKGDLRQSREKVRQLDATIVSLKQHKQNQSTLILDLEKENISLKQELEAQKEKTKSREAGGGLTEMESLQQENEALKAQMCRLSTQLIEAFQAQLVGLLPPSPHRTPRGQHRGEEAENAQDERERKMKNMEERMREIELSLHNVKLLLKEKVTQLKEQLHKNGKADVLIKDLYVENDQLLKALEITEQRHKISEKKNYLLEEKISSLTKILRDLSPSTVPALQYHFTCP